MSAELDRYRSQFVEHAGRWQGQEPSWLSVLRRDAFERFLERGFPATSEEDWRFTSVAHLAPLDFSLGTEASVGGDVGSLLENHLPGEWERHELVFVNGRFVEELSSMGTLPDGVVVTSLERALEDHTDEVEAVLGLPPAEGSTAFFDLNQAFVDDGAFVFVPEGTVVERPIHLVFLTSARMPVVCHPHNIVMVERSGQVRVVESHLGSEGSVYFNNVVSEIVAASGASVSHEKLQRESTGAFHMASLRFLQARSTTIKSLSLALGGRLSRNDIHGLLDGQGADLTLDGLYVVRGTQHVDHHTVIDHKEPHCASRELYKGVLDGHSSGVFNGRIIVRPNAQKTSAQQTNKNLLLSEDALVNTNPQLEIEADDVKCAHGATIGQLDKDALFYLRSRGIDQEEAGKILTRAFMADVSERIRVEAVRTAMRRFVFPEAA